MNRKTIFIIIFILLIPILFWGRWLDFIQIKEARAAEATVDSAIHATATSHNGSSPTIVFISDQVGYAFFRDSAGSCAYSKTSDGGGTWAATVTVDAQTDCFKIAVWYDRWTPGDSTGNYIHIATLDTNDLWYARLNTSDDTLTTIVNASGANQAGGFAVGANIPSIIKGTDGDLYMGAQDAADSFVIKCATGADCTSITNWTEAGTNPFDLATDWLILMPLASGNILAIRFDISADDVQSKVYTDSTNTWDASWTTVDADAIPNGTYDAHFGATLNKTTNNIYLVYATDLATFGTNDDIRSATYSSGAWTNKTDILTDDTKGITGVKIGLDENTGDLYAIYTARTTAGTAATGNVYWKKSSDSMTSWGTEQGPVNTTAGDLYGARVNLMSNERLYATWDLPSADDLMGNTIVDLTPSSDTTAPAAVSDLALSAVTASAMTVSWTAPGDDNSTGTATTYDLRYSTATITTGNFSSATAVSGEPTPSVAGSSESMSVSGLTANTTYYFALKTSDEVPNTSGISNVPSTSTLASADTTAPATISNLAVSETMVTAVTLTWTAPGDDNNTGTATSYDLRYSTSAITSGNFSSATAVSGEPTPSVAGSAESMTVTSLSQSTTYFFAIKTSDEVPNTSAVSNSPSTTTLSSSDTTAPAAVSNLALSDATASSITVSWTAPGDDNNTGTATAYDLRYSTSAITSGNFSSATAVTGEPTPSVAGSAESMTVTSLSQSTTYFFAIKTSDEVPNTSSISNLPSLSTSVPSVATYVTPSSGGKAPPTLNLSGQAYPGSTIKVLRKANISETYLIIPEISMMVKEDGFFSISHVGVTTGEYFYALEIKDRDGRKTIMSFEVDLLTQNSFTVRNILVAPTVEIKNTLLAQTENLRLVGYAAASSTIEVEIDGIIIKGAFVSDANGYYDLNINTDSLAVGARYIRVRQVDKHGIKSDWSLTKTFKKTALLSLRGDFNTNGKVDITDWSIFLYRWGSSDPKLRLLVDLDGNGLVNITDLSIFFKLMEI